MAEQGSDTTTARFLDYLGLALVLAGTDVLVREGTGAVTLTALLYAGGAVALLAGLNWKRVKPQLTNRSVFLLGQISTDPRYWLAILAFLIIAARITTPGITLASP